MFNIKVHGKWILAGEHAVLRGYPALVFPVSSRYLVAELKNEKGPFALSSGSEDLNLILNKIFNRALEKINKSFADLKGQLTVQNNVPLGAGMGGSAVLCVTVAKLFRYYGWLEDHEVYEFAKKLEDLFHGESSGVDVAVALANSGLLFYRNGDRKKIILNEKPNWYLSHCGTKGITSVCVSKVKALEQSNPELFKMLDSQMGDCVLKAVEILSNNPMEELKLIEVINQASSCFEQWGLVTNELQQHMKKIKSAGALAVKPTGSGEGGFVISLWPKNFNPPCLENIEFIKA